MKKSKAKKPSAAKPNSADLMAKTFMELEQIKKRFEPSVYAKDGRWQNIIEMAQQLRADGRADKDIAYSLIAQGCIAIGEKRFESDAVLAGISADIRKLEKKHGLKHDEIWLKGEAPDDVERLRAKWEQRADQIIADIFREYGEDLMADAFLADPEAFIAIIQKTDKARDKSPGNTGS